MLGKELEFNKYLLNEFQACGQKKHGGERKRIFGEMKVIQYDLNVEYIILRNVGLGWRIKQRLDRRRPF